MKIKKLPLLVRLIFAIILAFLFMILLGNFPTNSTLFGVNLDWIVSVIVFGIIYGVFFNVRRSHQDQK